MTTATLGPATAWGVAAALGLGAYALRLSFILLSSWVAAFPPRVERALQYVPVAVLAAIVSPALLSVRWDPVGLTLTVKTFAGAVAAVVAWRTESMTATIAVGMAVLLGAQVLLG